MKKFFSMILLVGIITVSGVLATAYTEVSYASESDVYNKLISLKAQFPDGKYYDHYVDQAGYDAYVARDEQFQNSVTDHPCNHNASRVGNYDCNYFDGGSQCWGFACKLFYEVFGIRASQTPVQYDKNISVGDWVRLTSEHSGIVLSINGDTFTMAECNIDYNDKIGWGTITYNKSRISYYKHAENYDSIAPAAPVSNLKATKIKSITVKTKGFKVTWNKVKKCTGYEIYYSTDPEFNNSKCKTVKGESKTSATISGLAAKTTYYVKVRVYKGAAEPQYSKWSAVRHVKTKAVQYMKIYKPILKEYKRVFSGKKLNTHIMTKKQSGLYNCWCGLCTVSKGKLIKGKYSIDGNCDMNLRYAIHDINGDDTDELIVADTWGGGYAIYSIWTTDGKKPIYLAHSEYRNYFYAQENGYLRNHGSNGAETWVNVFYSINGTKLERVAGVSCNNGIYYPNENGEGTPSRSAYDNIMNQYNANEMTFSWKRVK